MVEHNFPHFQHFNFLIIQIKIVVESLELYKKKTQLWDSVVILNFYGCI